MTTSLFYGKFILIIIIGYTKKTECNWLHYFVNLLHILHDM